MDRRSQELPAGAIEALAKGQKIEAIRIVRLESGLDLKRAKDTVDAYIAARPDTARQIQEASRTTAKQLWLWLLLLVAAIVVYAFLRRA